MGELLRGPQMLMSALAITRSAPLSLTPLANPNVVARIISVDQLIFANVWSGSEHPVRKQTQQPSIPTNAIFKLVVAQSTAQTTKVKKLM